MMEAKGGYEQPPRCAGRLRPGGCVSTARHIPLDTSVATVQQKGDAYLDYQADHYIDGPARRHLPSHQSCPVTKTQKFMGALQLFVPARSQKKVQEHHGQGVSRPESVRHNARARRRYYCAPSSRGATWPYILCPHPHMRAQA